MNIANLLTFGRILAIPYIVYSFYGTEPYWMWIGFGLYSIAAITDFFDGYIARKWNITTRLGRFLDPLADKLIVTAMILMLAGFSKIQGIHLVPAVIILCREMTISGLREHLSALSIDVPVSSIAKWKTTIQMFSLGFLMVGDDRVPAIPSGFIGNVLLWISALLSVYSGFKYLSKNWKHVQ